MKPLGKALAAAALTLLASTAAKAQVTLDVLYAFPAFAKFHEPIAAEFMKKHPDIKINFRRRPRAMTRAIRRCCGLR